MKKLLVICGPTATGKTKLAIRLAKKFDGELVSADSRQIYRSMDIGTGKDIPKGFEFRISKLGFKGDEVGYYTDGATRIWGYDLVSPREEFSVAQYIKIAGKVINDVWKPRQKLAHSGGQGGKLPILVGGTGLYIKGVVDGIPTAVVPKNLNLREQFKDKSVNEVQEILASIEPFKLAAMNASDRKNPRRLIRAIEIASSDQKAKSKKLKADILFVGLIAPKEILFQNIEKRVVERIKQGLEEEIIKLLVSGISWESQAMNSLGYKQWRQYYTKLGKKSGWKKGNTETLKEFEDAERIRTIEGWKLAEKQYVKRQITWFKKDKRINWFDISNKNYFKDVEKMVEKWYKS